MEIREMVGTPTGIFEMEVRREGELIQVIQEKNLIVAGAANQLSRFLGGDGENRHVSRIGFGVGTTAAAPGDTALTSPVILPIGSTTYPQTGRVRFSWSLPKSEGNGLEITEFGLLCADGTLFARKVREAIHKKPDLSLTGAWTIIF
ncbi:hypothetical protein ACMSSJ_10950 [Kerstersia gyiorum]|uniref:hypothetical protein n=1 Tax=Kerstersia gyiorum TaxID=206506 RepID=UPI0039ED4353